MAKNKKNHKGKGWLRRKGADRHLLYQWAVQAPDFEVAFIDRVYRRLRGSKALSLREDFCGTALVSRAWVASRRDRTAVGLDLDGETLGWAAEHNLARLGSESQRLNLIRQDVRTVTKPGADVVCAYNYSYYGLYPLRELVSYFQMVRKSLKPDGLFFMDSFGGWESQQVMEESREVTGPDGRFGYVWDQAAFNPVDNTITCHIHFEFAKGKTWRKAFTYRWRLYSPAEVTDALAEAGFTRSHVYWDRSPDDDDNDFRVAKRAENCPGWLAYLVAEA